MSKKRSWQSRFLKIPDSIEKKLKRIQEREIVVASVKRISISDIQAGEYTHLGIRLDDGKLKFEEKILPSPENGASSKINLHGKEIVRRDLPKEDKIFSFETPNWGDWSYGSHTVSYTREVYPRDFFPEKELELKIELLAEEKDDDKIVMKFTVEAILDQRNLNFRTDLLFALNLLQENVGVVDVYQSAAAKEEYLKSIYVNWEILPVGERDAVIARFLSAVKGKKDAIQEKLASRYDLLASLEPTEFIQGTNGFRRYFGARFGKNLVVFENIDYGNAIYVMFERWEELSKLSRLQLLSRKPDGFVRIVHKKGWEEELRDVITKRHPSTTA